MAIKNEGVQSEQTGSILYWLKFHKIFILLFNEDRAGKKTDFIVTVNNTYPTLSTLNVLYEVTELGQHVQSRPYRRSVLEQRVRTEFLFAYNSSPTLYY